MTLNSHRCILSLNNSRSRRIIIYLNSLSQCLAPESPSSFLTQDPLLEYMPFPLLLCGAAQQRGTWTAPSSPCTWTVFSRFFEEQASFLCSLAEENLTFPRSTCSSPFPRSPLAPNFQEMVKDKEEVSRLGHFCNKLLFLFLKSI